MTTMLEKAARALADHNLGQPEEWQRFVPEARAALLAIREPDADIVVAGWGREADGISPAFTAMIDAILNEPEGET